MSRKHCGKRGNCSLRAKLEVYEIRASANKKLNAKKIRFSWIELEALLLKTENASFPTHCFQMLSEKDAKRQDCLV